MNESKPNEDAVADDDLFLRPAGEDGRWCFIDADVNATGNE